MVVDIIASVLLILTAAILALGVITTAIAYQGLTAACGAGPYEGITCNGTALSIVTIAMIGVTVLAAFLGAGWVIVGLIRRRYTFYWPLASIAVMVAVIWIGSSVAGMIVP